MSFLEKFQGRTALVNGHGQKSDPIERTIFSGGKPIEKEGWRDYLRSARQKEIDTEIRTRENLLKREISNLDIRQKAMLPKIRTNKLLKTYPKLTKLEYKGIFESRNEFLCQQVETLTLESRKEKYLKNRHVESDLNSSRPG